MKLLRCGCLFLGLLIAALGGAVWYFGGEYLPWDHLPRVSAVAREPVGEVIYCALSDGDAVDEAEFNAECRLERRTDDAGALWVVHHPDGTFRRLRLRGDGSGLTAADGAFSGDSRISGDNFEVQWGLDRYRIPRKAPDSGAL
jgi:hypothetical protein